MAGTDANDAVSTLTYDDVIDVASDRVWGERNPAEWLLPLNIALLAKYSVHVK